MIHISFYSDNVVNDMVLVRNNYQEKINIDLHQLGEKYFLWQRYLLSTFSV